MSIAERATQPRAMRTAWVGQTRVHFGAGAVEQLPQALDLEQFGARVAIVASPSQDALGRVARLRGALGRRAAGTFAQAIVHTPQELYSTALTELRGASGLVALGGGAAIGLGKALAVGLGLPLAAIPTTYSGSEMTPIYGIAEGGEKRISRSELAQARLVLYDPLLPATLPPYELCTSLVNCLAHCLENAWLADASPLGLILSEDACRSIGAQRERVAKDELDETAATALMAAAWFGGVALAVSGVGLHHALCHAIGGLTNAAHGAIHTVVLPLVARLNDGAGDGAQQRLAAALAGGGLAGGGPAGGGPAGEDLAGDELAGGSLVDCLELIYQRWQLPRRLSEIGVQELDVDATLSHVLGADSAARNVRQLDADELRAALATIM
ncbi:MAG TPA: iron-containing alcohol dehydrogenase [Solirubrobacteraceae bacterium]|jgi:maleylacetate reductase